MVKNKKNYLFLGIFALFFILTYAVFQDALPASKNKRIYSEIKSYLPYKIEQRTGGLKIVFSDGREEIKPSNADIFHITDKLDIEWGKEHLLLDGRILVILDDNKNAVKKLELDDKEKAWVAQFFGI
jgi:hypothetical protein